MIFILQLLPNMQLYEMTFGDIAGLPFPCLIQILYDMVSMSEVPGVDAREEARGVAQNSMIKGKANLVLTQRTHMPLIVILTQSEGLSVPVEPMIHREEMLVLLWILRRGS